MDPRALLFHVSAELQCSVSRQRDPDRPIRKCASRAMASKIVKQGSLIVAFSALNPPRAKRYLRVLNHEINRPSSLTSYVFETAMERLRPAGESVSEYTPL